MTAGSDFPGARIFLDDQGWSVGIDVLSQATETGVCPTTYPSVADTTWSCEIDYTNNTRVGGDFFRASFAVPFIWWSDASGLLDSPSINPERGGNPWDSLGKGGDTVMMKMVVSAARGNRKHTFMVSAMKTTILAFDVTKIRMEDVRDVVQRTWRAGDSAQVQTDDLDAIEAALGKDYTGLTLGRQHSDGYKVTSRNYQLQTTIVGTISVFTAFQLLDVNITLINSETLQQAPTPVEPCDTWYQNIAYGGVLVGSDCALAAREDGRTSVFQGQVDTMAVFIISGTLGKKRATTSVDALNEDAWRWTQDNNHAMEALVLSRAYIVAGNPVSVKIDVQAIRPAVSVLQLFLALLPVLIFVLSWGVVLGWVDSHFQSSLFSNLVATTHQGYDSEKPEYMMDPPKFEIKKVDGRVFVGTDTGVFWHSGRENGAGEAA